ncbi:MAG: HNH endonuclease signature motif containing protein [Reyranellaceae bacterium]
MTRYWWVNHKQTVRQEVDGQYLWSPKTKQNGARNPFYDNMRRASPGDLVLSFANGRVAHIGRVAEFAFTAPKPEEFGKTGTYWHDEGWLLPVYWTDLDPAVQPKGMIEELRPLLPAKYSPIRPETGNGNQSVYLAEIDKAVLDLVLSGSAADWALLRRGGANSLNYRSVTELLDDRVEAAIKQDVGLDHTVREQVIQARRGQGRFRSNVEKIEGACRLTKVTNPTLLIASHIMPWRSCESATQRLDGMNGLLLTPDADLLFDRGFITFEDDGQVRVSNRFEQDDLRRLGLGHLTRPHFGFAEAPVAIVAGFKPAQCTYLDYHRREVFVGD